MAIAVRVDSQGRLTIPGSVRKKLDVKPGDTFFLEQEGRVLRYAKADNPFDALATYAIDDYRAGKTTTVDDLAQNLSVGADGE